MGKETSDRGHDRDGLRDNGRNFLRRLEDKPPYPSMRIRKGNWKVGHVELHILAFSTPFC